MIVLAWSFFVVVSLLVATNQAFLTAPVPGHAVSSYDLSDGQKRLENKAAIAKASNHRDRSEELEAEDEADEQQAVYVIEFETDPSDKDVDGRKREDDGSDGIDGQSSPLDPWSIVWYIGSFGGLVAFFLIVSCSEWCCRRGGRPLSVPYSSQRAGMINGGSAVTETPPPPYHLFAPPPYDSVNYGDIVDKTSGEKLDIYVISVPIHRPAMMQVPA